jgi:hypothetical protein
VKPATGVIFTVKPADEPRRTERLDGLTVSEKLPTTVMLTAPDVAVAP